MENVIIEMSIEVILSILAPLITVGAVAIRYSWKKEQCFTLMKQKIEELSKSEDTSHNTHGTLYEKISELENRATALETKMDLIIDHFEIKS